MNSGIKKVPKLRFPGFSDEWQKLRLVNIADFQEGPGILAVDFRETGVPLIRLKGLQRKIATLEGCNFLDHEKVTKKWNHFKLNVGDVLVSTSASLGTSSIVGEEVRGAIAYTGIIRFRPKEKTNRLYLEHLLTSLAFIKQIESMKTGATISHFGPIHLKQMYFFHPEENEQHIIAGFLTLIDDQIELMEKKLELSKKHKKGVMQKIFTQKLRFKDDINNYKNWGMVSLNYIADIKKGTQLNIENMLKDGEYPVLNGGINYSGHTNSFNTRANTITISEGGNSCGYVSFMGNDFWAGGHLYTISTAHNCKFLFQQLKYRQNEIMKLRVGSGLPNIQKKDIDRLIVSLPETKEQHKIADFLSNIDERIEKQERKLEQAKNFKKALLQQMLI